MKNKYLEEFEKYKHIKVSPGLFELKNTSIKYEVLEVNEEKNEAIVKTVSSGNVATKTVHWCRKNLKSIHD
jgi:hypothetical protein